MLDPVARWHLALVSRRAEETTVDIILLPYSSQSNSIPISFAGVAYRSIVIFVNGNLLCDGTYSTVDSRTGFVAFNLVLLSWRK